MDQQQPLPSDHSRTPAKYWIFALIILVLLITIGVLLQWRASKRPLAGPPQDEQYFAPILTPELETLDQIKEFTGGRPIPPVSQEATAGNVTDIFEHVRGNPDARISIVEYANLSGKYARLIHPEMVKFIEETDDANWIFRHYPIPSNKIDYPAAYISECVFRRVGKQAFWTYLDAVYISSPQSEEELFALVKPLEEDAERLVRQCYEDEDSELDVKANKRLGFTLGKVTMLPTFFFVDNLTGQERVVLGIDSMDFFRLIVDTMMRVEL